MKKYSKSEVFLPKGLYKTQSIGFFGPLLERVNKSSLFLNNKIIQRTKREAKLEKKKANTLKQQLDERTTEVDTLARLLMKSDSSLKTIQQEYYDLKSSHRTLKFDSQE